MNSQKMTQKEILMSQLKMVLAQIKNAFGENERTGIAVKVARELTDISKFVKILDELQREGYI